MAMDSECGWLSAREYDDIAELSRAGSLSSADSPAAHDWDAPGGDRARLRAHRDASLCARAVVRFKKSADFGRSLMRRGAWAAPLALAMMLQGAAAEQAGGNRPLDDKELLGMRLFNQSCRVCHTKPQMTSPLYGPELSRDSAGGQDTVMRDVISNGTPRMPGFKYHFEPAQIEAIVAYVRTIPPPPATAAPAR
jgi:mono/diheme cytochrome c family protein